MSIGQFVIHLTARLILGQLPTRRWTTDRINLQIKCLWPLLIYRFGQKWAVCVHECVCMRACVSEGVFWWPALKRVITSQMVRGWSGAGYVTENNPWGLIAQGAQGRPDRGRGTSIYVCVWEVGGGGCLSLTRPLLPITRLTIRRVPHTRVDQIKFHMLLPGFHLFDSSSPQVCGNHLHSSIAAHSFLPVERWFSIIWIGAKVSQCKRTINPPVTYAKWCKWGPWLRHRVI